MLHGTGIGETNDEISYGVSNHKNVVIVLDVVCVVIVLNFDVLNG